MMPRSSGHSVAVPSMDSKPSTCGRRVGRSAGRSACPQSPTPTPCPASREARSSHLGDQDANDDGQLVECPQGAPQVSGGDLPHVHGHQPRRQPWAEGRRELLRAAAHSDPQAQGE